MHKKSVLYMVCLLLVASAIFRPGYRIILNGKPLPGVYSPQTALQSAEAAYAVAEEITREHEDAPFTLIPVLCLHYTQTDQKQLCATLLRGYDGVKEVFAANIINGETVFARTYTYSEKQLY